MSATAIWFLMASWWICCAKPVVAAAAAGGYVLDGFPRTVEQAKASFPTARALGVEVQAAVHLDVAREELVRRLLSRRRGPDDTEAVIEHRLQVYLDKTVPLLEYYAGREWMFTVNGAQPPDAVHAEILTRLQKLADFATWTSQGIVRRQAPEHT
jgi:adenylate kinase